MLTSGFALTLLCSIASAPDAQPPNLVKQASIEYRFTPDAIDTVSLATFQDAPATQPEPKLEELETAQPAFGVQGHRRLYIQAHYGEEVDSNTHEQTLAGVGIEWFLDSNVSLTIEVNGMYITQNFGGDALGINSSLLVRWYHHVDDDWSIYFDAGFGLLFTDNDVPDRASDFNLTPQAGIGVSFAIGDDGNRLMLGSRWFHISNANTAAHNPGRDSIIGYVGFSLPF